MKHHQFNNDILKKNIIIKRKTVSLSLNNLINSKKNNLRQEIRALCSDYFLKCLQGKNFLVILLPYK